jgi:hypothetical protein
LAEREILERNRPVSAAEQSDRSEEHDQQVSMNDPAARPTAKSTGATDDQVLANYNCERAA